MVATPARSPFPSRTVALFVIPGAFGGTLAAWMRVRGYAPHWWAPPLVGAALAGLYSLGVMALRDTAGVQRLEQRLRRFFTPPRRLRMTREGRYFVGIALAIGFAAINTGNNLLYLLLGMMLSLILASGILSEMSLRGLRIERLPPARIEAGRPFLMGVALANDKRRLPSFSVEVEDLLGGAALDKKCWFLKVPAGKQQRTSYRHQLPRRGRYVMTGFRLSTKFPFALFRKSRLVEQEAEVIVLPQVHPVMQPSPPLRPSMGEEQRSTRGRRGEFYGLRDFREGDDARDVHWRSTARRGRPMVREHEDEAARRVTLFVDNGLPGGAACDDAGLLDGLERAISLAASLAAHYLERGYAARLVARGDAVGWASGMPHLDRLLRFLALLPTVEEQVAFAAPPEPGTESIHVARRGAPPRAGDPASARTLYS
jgi:uncharacterized protein (DUF58 family)